MKGKTKKLLISAAVAAAGFVFSLFTGELYFSSDNFDISLILNGYYATPFSQYQHPLFCVIAWLLSVIMPFADSFHLLLRLSVFAGTIGLTYIMLDEPLSVEFKQRSINDHLRILLAVFFPVTIQSAYLLYYTNYTVSAGGIVFLGFMILAYASKLEKGRFWIVLGTAVVCMGFMIRREPGMLFIPFAAVLAVTSVLAAGRKDKEAREKALLSLKKYLLPVTAAVIVLLGSQYAMNMFEPFASAKRYNDARTTVEDYDTKNWKELEGDPGFSEADYQAAKWWVLCDTDNMTADKLEMIADAGNRVRYSLNRWEMIVSTMPDIRDQERRVYVGRAHSRNRTDDTQLRI